jgi:GAF domain-containing protein
LRAENRGLRDSQAAVIEVLKTISASPGDAQSVFDLIACQAAKLCNVPVAAVARLQDGLLHLATQSGFAPAFAGTYATQFPRPVGADTVIGRAVLSGRPEQSEDVDSFPGYSVAREKGAWSALAVPLLRDNEPLGAIAVGRPINGPWSASQIALLQTFAEQAVIAIGGAETYRELAARTATLAQRNSAFGEQIQHQSATIDVLKVMSSSPGDTQPVFDLIVRRAQSLSNGMSVGLFEYDGTLMHIRAAFGGDEAAGARYAAMFPMAPTRLSLAGRAVLDRRVVHVRNMDAEPGLFQALRDLGAKATISIPLLRDDAAIGAISLNSLESQGLSDSQIELLRTFAEQAVIAITSAETYRELQARTAGAGTAEQ